MNYILEITGILVAYLIGSFSTAVWLGKTFYKIDVRTVGSKNAGATNTLRVLGVKPGLVVLLIDMLKGCLAVSLSHVFGKGIMPDSVPCLAPDSFVYYQLLMGIFAIVGHIFPLYTGFKGGKGVATIAGVLIGIYLCILPFVLGIFILVFFMFRYISVASITAAFCFPVIYWLSTVYFNNEFHTPLLVFACLVTVFIPVTHHKNIKRLLKGKEPKFKFKKTV